MIAAVFCVLFGLSLLPGRKPLCVRFAERISEGILPEGAIAYCRRLSWFWFLFLALLTASNFVCLGFARTGSRWDWAIRLAPSVCALVLIPLVFFIEKRIRDRRFRVVFRTSGSTGGSKTIVKTFEMLAKEVAWHRRGLASVLASKPLFLATIDPEHYYGTLWRRLLPEAAGCVCDPEVIRSPESLVAKMRSAEASGRSVFLVTTPSFLDRFTAYADQYEVPRNCVEIVTSGALLTKDVSDRTAGVFGIAPRQIFGSTETGGVAFRRGDGPWTVFDCVKVSSDDGRIAVKSPFCFRRRYVMGDGCELAPDGRTFRLLGRRDRLVKINEERVDLAEMEEKVRSLGYRDCALAELSGDHGPVLGLVLADDPSSCRERPTAMELRRALLPVFPKGTVPKRFRFVSELPRNHQGKVLKSAVVRILESSLAEPPVTRFERTDASLTAEFRFEPDAPYFQGHFPGAPVLPGVAQLGLAERFAEALRGSDDPLKAVKRMKFMSIVVPGDTVTLSLRLGDDGSVGYEYRKGERLCSSGVLVF